MKLAVIFNGQGAHYQGMGLDFTRNHQVSQTIFEEAESILDLPIRQWIAEDIERFKCTKNAQPGILVTSLAIYKTIEKQLPAIQYMAGLSLGEYTALIAAGYLSFAEGLNLVKTRGQLMSQHCQDLALDMDIQMAAVMAMPQSQIEELVKELHSEATPIYLANYNSADQIVVAGSAEAINQFKQEAQNQGYRKVIPLKVEGPFHTPMMAEVQASFRQALDRVDFNEGHVAVVANIDSQVHDLHLIREKLENHLSHPVRWSQTIEFFKRSGVTHILQIGPGHTLAKLLGESSDFSVYVIDKVSDLQGLEEFLQGGLKCH